MKGSERKLEKAGPNIFRFQLVAGLSFFRPVLKVVADPCFFNLVPKRPHRDHPGSQIPISKKTLATRGLPQDIPINFVCLVPTKNTDFGCLSNQKDFRKGAPTIRKPLRLPFWLAFQGQTYGQLEETVPKPHPFASLHART